MTPTPTLSPFYLLAGGKWIHLEGVLPGVSITSDRPSSSSTSLGGVVRSQRARRVARSWELSFRHETAEALRWLGLAAQGLVGDVYLLDQAAAQINMLDPRDTVGLATAPTVAVNGVALPMLGLNYPFSVKVRAGVTYHFSCVTSRLATFGFGTYNLGAGPVTMIAPAGTGARPASVSFTPATDGEVDFVIFFASGTGSSGLRLTEGSVDTLGFIPGRKAVCQVSVSDPGQVLHRVNVDELPESDYSITLREVGL